MSQAENFGLHPTGPASGSEVAQRANASFNALLTDNSGPTEPLYKDTGTTWLDTANASIWYAKRWDGAAWIVQDLIDPVTHKALSLKLKQIVRITSSGTYVPSAGVRAIRVRGVGGGGAGGGASTVNGNGSCGSGGGAGGYAEEFIASLAASYSVTIGAAGVGVAGGDGGSGGNTVFGSVFTANGGSGGKALVSSVASIHLDGGLGGSASGTATIKRNGAKGGNCLKTAQTSLGAGDGAGSPFGTGGDGPLTNSAQTVTLMAGNAGYGYGAGGGGSYRYTAGSTTVTIAGASGAPGYIEIEEYV